MADTISIPKQEYEFLLKCKEIVVLEHEKPLSKQTLARLHKAETHSGIVLRSKAAVRKYLSQL